MAGSKGSALGLSNGPNLPADGIMTPQVRGWCPSLFEPMQSGDGMLLRIKPSLSRLSAACARWLARASLRHGNGAIELTNRGNLQFRGFTPVSAALFAEEAVAAGLASADPAAERRRNILVSPLAGDDPACSPDTLDVARALESGLVLASTLSELPAKFAFLVDGGGASGLSGVRADVILRADGTGWRIEAGNAATTCTVGEAPLLALRLAHAALAGDAGPGPGPHFPGRPAAIRPLALRPARHPDCGPALFRSAGLPHEPATPRLEDAPVTVGSLPGHAFGIGLPPGRLDATLLFALATLAERCGDGTLRITPWRTILFAGVDRLGETLLRAALSDQLLDPHDPRLRTASCIGSRGCRNASVPAPADAARLGAMLPANTFLHVSGCPKGCGHPGPAALTLVGRDGRYDLIRNGRAWDPPAERGLDVDAAAELLHHPVGATSEDITA